MHSITCSVKDDDVCNVWYTSVPPLRRQRRYHSVVAVVLGEVQRRRSPLGLRVNRPHLTKQQRVHHRHVAVPRGAVQRRPTVPPVTSHNTSPLNMVIRPKKATPWRAEVYVLDANKKYVVGYFATKKEAATAYEADGALG